MTPRSPAIPPPPIAATDPPELSKQYPHVDNIADWRAQQSIRLLWDRTYELEARLQAAEGTTTTLVTAANDHQEQITFATRKASEALAQAQLTKFEAKQTGGPGSGGGPSGGPGSPSDPIIPMSADPVVMEGNIKASLYHWGRADYTYWLSIVATPWQGGDSKWYQGWDAYMEERARPGNAGFAGHDLLPEPALYTTAPPSGYPTGGWT